MPSVSIDLAANGTFIAYKNMLKSFLIDKYRFSIVALVFDEYVPMTKLMSK